MNESRVQRAVSAYQSNAWPEAESRCGEILPHLTSILPRLEHWVRRYDYWRNILSSSS